MIRKGSLASASAYLNALREFASALAADADQIDTDEALLAHWYARFAAEGLHVGWSALQPLTGRELCEALALLAESSGAFAFVALQQFVANVNLSGHLPDDVVWPCGGVAFGQLRNLRGPCPRLEGGFISGSIPWITGAHIFPSVVLGLLDRDGSEIHAVVDSTNRRDFQHGAPMDLVACRGTYTVSVRLSRVPVGDLTVLTTEPAGTFAQNDIRGVLYQTPLMFGCVRARMKLIESSTRVVPAEKAVCGTSMAHLLESVYAAFEGSTPEEGARLRAQLGDFSVRLARLATMACGGAGLVRPHPAQRLYREALLYSLMAQTDRIVGQAFQEVFG